MKKKHIIWLAVCIFVIGAVITVWILISNVQKNLEALKTIEISDVDLSAVQDGAYEGSFSQFPISAKVRVTIKDHRIESIELLEHKHGKGGAAETIPDKVTEAQSLQVDAVSGATGSSQVIKKAIQNALETAE